VLDGLVVITVVGNGYDDNDWPEWTPMYWMEEMMDEWDDNDDDNYPPECQKG
jgi:hypothetical protein